MVSTGLQSQAPLTHKYGLEYVENLTSARRAESITLRGDDMVVLLYNSPRNAPIWYWHASLAIDNHLVERSEET